MFVVNRPILRWCAIICLHLSSALPTALVALWFQWPGDVNVWPEAIIFAVLLAWHLIRLFHLFNLIRFITKQFRLAYPGFDLDIYPKLQWWQLPLIIVIALAINLLPSIYHGAMITYGILCAVDIICIIVLGVSGLYWKRLGEKKIERGDFEILDSETSKNMMDGVMPVGFAVKIDLETGEMEVGMINFSTENASGMPIIDVTPEENQDQNT